MQKLFQCFFLMFVLSSPLVLYAQIPPVANPDHERMLASVDPKLAANKRLVYDFWREVLEARHMDLANKYLTESYIQHNPNVATGRAALVKYFSQFPTTPIAAHVKAPLINIVAEGDLVIVCSVQPMPDAKDPSKSYTTTQFDMFRIEGGKIAEHWDPDRK